MEITYITEREQGEDEAARLVALVKAWPITWVYPDEKTLLQAAKLKATHRLSVADALIAAVAKLSPATLGTRIPSLMPSPSRSCYAPSRSSPRVCRQQRDE
jgi:ribonuclease VapC